MGFLSLFKSKCLEEKEMGDIVVLIPHRDLGGGDETFELEDRLRELIAQGNRRLILNLRHVKFTGGMGFSRRGES